MKCFSCRKKFDYDKFYGICPKCGAYNKRETSEAAHMELHDAYDGGYRHTRSPNLEQPVVRRDTQGTLGTAADQADQRSSIFLRICIGILVLSVVFSPALKRWIFSIKQANWQKQAETTQVSMEEVSVGTPFSFQKLELCVEEAQVLDWGEGLNLPPGKKLIGVRISGRNLADHAYSDESTLQDAYIRVGDRYFWQIGWHDYEKYAIKYGKPALNPYAFQSEQSAEDGWLAFLLDAGEDSFTLCLEERTGVGLADLKTIYEIQLKLEGE